MSNMKRTIDKNILSIIETDVETTLCMNNNKSKEVNVYISKNLMSAIASYHGIKSDLASNKLLYRSLLGTTMNIYLVEGFKDNEYDISID